jgi:hypothetical protein
MGNQLNLGVVGIRVNSDKPLWSLYQYANCKIKETLYDFFSLGDIFFFIGSGNSGDVFPL